MVGSAERIQRLPAPFLSELRDLRRGLERRGRAITDLGRYTISIPAPPARIEVDETQIRRTFAEYLAKRYEVELDADRELLLLPGAKSTLLLLNAYFADQDTICHYPDPGYDSYRVFGALFDASLRPYPLLQRNDFLLNLEQFPVGRRREFGMLLVTSPQNPTGSLCDHHFYQRLYKKAAAANLLVIADSSYALPYAGAFRPPLFSESRRRLKTGLEIISLSTGFLNPNLKLTVVIGRRSLIQPLTALARLLNLRPSQAMFELASGYFVSHDALDRHVERCRAELQSRTELMTEALKAAEIEHSPVCGAGFAWVKLRPGRVSLAFARSLLRSKGVLVAPGSAFGENGEGWVRICANVAGEELQAAMQEFVRHFHPIKSRLRRGRDD